MKLKNLGLSGIIAISSMVGLVTPSYAAQGYIWPDTQLGAGYFYYENLAPNSEIWVDGTWTTGTTGPQSSGVMTIPYIGVGVGATWSGAGSSGSILPGAPVVPGIPTGLKATPEQRAISLSWNAQTDAASFNIYEQGQTSPIKTGIIGTNYTAINLKANTTYGFYITATSSGGFVSGDSPTVTATTLPPVPPTLSVNGGTDIITGSIQGGLPPYTVSIIYQGKTIETQSMAASGDAFSYTTLQGNYTIDVIDAEGGQTSQTVTVIAPVLATPTSISQTGTPSGSGTISWTGSSNAPVGTTYTIYDNGQAIGTTTTSPYQVQNYDPNAVYTVVASAPNYQSSQPVSQYGIETGKAMSLGFSPLDLIQNSAALVASVGSLLLLVLVIMFAPRLIRLLRRTNGGRKRSEWDYFDPNYQEWVIDPVTINDSNEKTKSVSDSMVPDVHSRVQDRKCDYRINTERNFDTEIR